MKIPKGATHHSDSTAIPIFRRVIVQQQGNPETILGHGASCLVQIKTCTECMLFNAREPCKPIESCDNSDSSALYYRRRTIPHAGISLAYTALIWSSPSSG
ncbi:hypothetical protein HBH96_228590 [Parastagonospora nodorum]|nr:hypothetical protein HBH60_151600 [Parastagonospora nodorum]KAH5047382.1 hypothetical protein HBH96_228590 [Parastagonospora nodorum]